MEKSLPQFDILNIAGNPDIISQLEGGKVSEEDNVDVLCRGDSVLEQGEEVQQVQLPAGADFGDYQQAHLQLQEEQ